MFQHEHVDFDAVTSELVTFLKQERFRCALVGGLALQAYGISRATFDLDLLTSEDAKEKLVGFLEQRGYQTLHLSGGFSNHAHRDPARGRVDLIYVDKQTEEKLFARIDSTVQLGAVRVDVPRPEHLIAMKVHAIKSDPSRTYKDMADIQALLKVPGVDHDEVRDYFLKAGMLERLNELKKTI